ncbi:MAG: acetyl-CoA carboxylase biotin carboxyl carrier protein subunit [Pyrinomonadaceae bacterium]
MKLIAETGENRLEVEIVHYGRTVTASIDGRTYTLESSEPETGVFLLKLDNVIYEAIVNTGTDGGFDVQLMGTGHQIRMLDRKRLRGSDPAEANLSGRVEIKTAMPGKVVRILVAEGDTVQKGDGIIVVEAMKMQNEMRSPKDGTISEIKAAEGRAVAAGDVLVVIE